MTLEEVEFAVVGAGMAGSATARALARKGRDVVLLERFEVGHKRGSSHGASRIFRFSYDDPVYVRMAMEALPLWRELEAETGEELVITAGGLDAGKNLDGHVGALRACGAELELLDGDAANRRFPVLNLPRSEPVLYQPDAGIAKADAAVRVFVSSAVAGGARLVEGTAVQELRLAGEGVEVATEDVTYRARVAVVAAGAWARGLLEGVGIELPVTPTRETVAYFHLDGEATIPSLVDWGDPIFYALANPGGGLKAGLHHGGPVTDPDDAGVVDDDTVAQVSERVAARYHGVDPEPFDAETCIYTNTADERFIIERRGPVVIGSACSGHGFKFAPLTGARLADLALAG